MCKDDLSSQMMVYTKPQATPEIIQNIIYKDKEGYMKPTEMKSERGRSGVQITWLYQRLGIPEPESLLMQCQIVLVGLNISGSW